MSLQQYLKEHYSSSTARLYEREIDIYKSNYALASKAKHKDIVAYIGKLRKRYSNKGTIVRIVCSIKVYYAYLVYSGKRSDNPAASILLRDKINRDIQLQDLFTQQELEALLEKEERYKGLKIRNQVLMSLLVYQGMQTGELSRLLVSDIDLKKATVKIKESRSCNARTLNLRPTQILLFQQYLNEVREKLMKGNSTTHFLLCHRGKCFTAANISSHIFRTYGKIYAPRKVTTTTIRQSVITNLLKAGNDLRIVQVFAGHKYPSSTEKYKQSELKNLEASIENFHPLS